MILESCQNQHDKEDMPSLLHLNCQGSLFFFGDATLVVITLPCAKIDAQSNGSHTRLGLVSWCINCEGSLVHMA